MSETESKPKTLPANLWSVAKRKWVEWQSDVKAAASKYDGALTDLMNALNATGLPLERYVAGVRKASDFEREAHGELEAARGKHRAEFDEAARELETTPVVTGADLQAEVLRRLNEEDE